MSGYTLRPSATLERVYLYREPVDFRRSYRGLAVIVEQELGHNPFSGTLYIFINRRRDKLKGVFWESNGFVLYYKALAEDCFHWPDHDQAVLTISGQQLNWLLDGYNLEAMRPHRALHYEALG